MPLQSGVIGNRTINISAANAPAAWNAPVGTTWFYLEATGAILLVQFDTEAPIIFPRRSLRSGSFKQIVFTQLRGAGGACVATFRFGAGVPPAFATLEDGDSGFLSEQAAACNIAGGATVDFPQVAQPVMAKAVHISVPSDAANGVWVSEAGGAVGKFINPGDDVRIPYSGLGQVQIFNPGAGQIQTGVMYEIFQ